MQMHAHAGSGPDDIESDIARNMFKVLFGESALYVGDGFNVLPERRRANVVRIADSAIRRLGARIADPGRVPPRIVGAILSGGSYCDDRLACEYWGGIVAASRSPDRSDDRGLRLLKLLDRLTLHQIRTHFLLYATLRRLLMTRASPGEIDFENRRYRMAVFVPAASYLAGMGFGGPETFAAPELIDDALSGLGMEALLDGSNYGAEEYLKRFFKTGVIRGEGIVFAPSIPGIRLFLRGAGAGGEDLRSYAEAGPQCAVDGVPAFLEGSGLVYDADFGTRDA